MRNQQSLCLKTFASCTAAAVLLTVGCAQQRTEGTSTAAAPMAQPNTGSDTAPAQPAAAPMPGSLDPSSTQPISADAAVLNVSGMSCPKCATNIDLELKSVAGVDDVAIDMGSGEVTVALGKIKPSPSQLARAVNDAGFTLNAVRVR